MAGWLANIVEGRGRGLIYGFLFVFGTTAHRGQGPPRSWGF